MGIEEKENEEGRREREGRGGEGRGGKRMEEEGRILYISKHWKEN